MMPLLLNSFRLSLPPKPGTTSRHLSNTNVPPVIHGHWLALFSRPLIRAPQSPEGLNSKSSMLHILLYFGCAASRRQKKLPWFRLLRATFTLTRRKSRKVYMCSLRTFGEWEGVRRQLTLEHAVLSVETGERLDSRVAEKLIDDVVQHGKPFDVAEFSTEHDTLVSALRACDKVIEDDYLAEMAAFEGENANRVAEAQMVIARADRKLDQLRRILEQQKEMLDERQRRVIPLTEARIRRAQEDRDQQLARIERQGLINSSFRAVVGGLIVVRPIS